MEWAAIFAHTKVSGRDRSVIVRQREGFFL
jgi:hypothetical protein